LEKQIDCIDHWKSLQPEPTIIHRNEFSKEVAYDLGYVSSCASKMSEAIDAVLSNRTLECSPFTPAELPSLFFEYATGNMHMPVKVDLDTGSGNLDQYRTVIDGITLLQKLERMEDVIPFVHVNAHVLPPSVLAEREARHQLHDDNDVKRQFKKAIGFTCDGDDPDYVFNMLALKAQGHIPCYEFMKLLTDDAELLESLSHSTNERLIPNPLPLGFGPLSYVIQRRICSQLSIVIGKGVYPRDNIHQQIKNSMEFELCQRQPKEHQRKGIQNFSSQVSRTDFGNISFNGLGDEAYDRLHNEEIYPTMAEVPKTKPTDEDADAMDIDRPS